MDSVTIGLLVLFTLLGFWMGMRIGFRYGVEIVSRSFCEVYQNMDWELRQGFRDAVDRYNKKKLGEKRGRHASN